MMPLMPRRSQSLALQSNGNSGASFSGSRGLIESAPNDDPLQPLRAMADRVGKEVEKFAERVDEWHSHGNGSERDLYQTTLHMVDSLKEFADSTVEELRDQSGAENRGELQKSVRRRIKKMAEEARPDLDFQSVLTSTEPHAGPQSARVQELRHWEAEAATWDLLRIIIEHYHPEPGHDIEAEKRERLAAMGDTNRYSPNIEIWDRFLLEDDEAKEKEIVLRWLERTAQNSESDIKSITEQLEAESGKDTQTWTSGWLDTKFKLKQEKRLNHMDRHFGEAFHGLKANDEAQDLVTQLDPDAPTRQKRALAKSDEYYERALWMVCYEMLRRGVPWGEVSEWCKDKNEAWRGISLGAADETHPDGVPNLSGPTAGYLFRRMCYCAAIGSRTQYEAAVYGLLSGDVETVESVCRSWDDHLYARYNALLLSRFDEYLLKNYPRRLPQAIAQKFVFRDAAAKMDSWESSSAEVIDLLKSQRSTAALAELPIKLIQSSLIGGGMSKLVRKIGEALGLMLKKDTSITSLFWDPASDGVTSKSHSISSSQQSTGEKCYQTLAVDSNCLRILVHIFIVLRKGLGLLEEENEAERANLDNIIIAYIEFLRMTKRILLIPLYAAQLDGDRPYHCLARILPDIRNPEEQKEFIKLLEGYDLDPARVLAGNFAHIAETLTRENKHTYIPKYTLLEETKEPDDLWPGVRVRRQFAGLDINPSDDLILDSMRWHLHLEREIETTFPVLHTGLMYLLRMGRIGAAMELIKDLSLETLSLTKTQALCGYAFDFLADSAEIQDREEVSALRASTSGSNRSSFRLPKIPTEDEHHELVLRLREESRIYLDLQNLVHLIILFQDWRAEEDRLILIRQSSEAGTIIPTKKIREQFDQIDATLESIFDSFLDDLDDEDENSDAHAIKTVYIPEAILTYISVVQAISWFNNRDNAAKAMNIATVIADDDRPWLQTAFLASGRMTELVDLLARFSRSMLRMTEEFDYKPGRKKGKKGQTIRIWDVNVRN